MLSLKLMEHAALALVGSAAGAAAYPYPTHEPCPKASAKFLIGSAIRSVCYFTRPARPCCWRAAQTKMRDGMRLVVICVAYMISSAGMSVFNKLAVKALPLPVTLVVLQMLFTVVFLTACNRKALHYGSRRDVLRWGCTIPWLFAAMLVSSMVAMEHNTLGTVVVFRNVAPLFTLFIERLFRVPMQVNVETVAALLTIVAGVVLYYNESIGLTRMGLISISLNLTFAVLERLLQRHLLSQEPVDMSKPGMMLLNNAIGLVPCGMLCAAYQEPARWDVASSELTVNGAVVLLLSCLNGLAISYAGLQAQQLVTATTFMVLTNVNKFVVVGFGLLFLGDKLSVRALFGVALAIAGGVWYGKARVRLEQIPSPSSAHKRGQQEDDEEAQPVLPTSSREASPLRRS